jgi:inorganic pyrophosphatase
MGYRDPVHVGSFASDVTINAVIETPAGSRIEYKWDPEVGAYRAAHVLPLGMAFPFDLGFVPVTKADDGDPLDVLVIADALSNADGSSTLVRNDRLEPARAFALVEEAKR